MSTSLRDANHVKINDDEKDSELLVELVLTDTVRIHLVGDTVGGGEIGCKLWTAAVMLNGALRSNPELIRGKKVLEIGAGLGACGLCSAVLEASSTTICDCGPESLLALSRTLAAYSQMVRRDNDDYETTTTTMSPATTTAATTTTAAATTIPTTKWDALNISLRRHLWEEDLEFLESRDEDRPMDTIRHWSKNGSQDDEAPMLPFEETFDVVLGSDLLYFSSQEKPLLAVLQLRLRATGGVALILQTMRTNNVSVFQRFLDAAHTLFDVTVRTVAPEELCRIGEQKHVNETPHTTGYKLVTITVKKND
jgi:predicted nicotinamide N-methyase